jgi:hypothetical protein
MNDNLKKYPKIKIIAFVAIIITLLVIAFLGYGEIKKFINKRNDVVTTLNQNTAIYNSSTETSKELLINIKNLLDINDLEETKIQANISKLDIEIPKISELSGSIEKSSKNLIKGEQVDSQNAYTLFSEGLATKKATMDILNSFVKYEACLIKNSSNQYLNINEFSQQLAKFSSADDKVSSQDKAGIVELANKKINDNIALTNSISGCFEDKYGKFLTNEMKEDLAKDVALYSQYADATKALSEGLSKNSSTLLQTGTTQLLELKDKNPIFFSTENFKKAVQEPKKLLQDQATILENQEKKIKNQTQLLKSKYLLD